MSYNTDSLVVAYFSSDLFAEPCGVSIVSLFENNQDFSSITVYVVEDRISENNRQKLYRIAEEYGRTINLIPMPDPQKFFGDERFTVKTLGHTYARMIVGQLLPEEVERLLCIDSDMLILQSFKELWQMDMQDNYLAGVDSAPGLSMMQKSLGIEPGTLYCNGGFFMVNLKAVRNDNLEKKYVQYILLMIS